METDNQTESLTGQTAIEIRAPITFSAHLRLVCGKAFEEFEVGGDMVIGTFVALLGLAMLVHFNLIASSDWKERKWLWLLCTVTPYVVVIGFHAAWKLARAPSRLYQEQAEKVAASEKSRLESEQRIYDGRPILMLEVLGQPSVENGGVDHPGQQFKPPAFGLYNCGARTARFVRVEPITSRLGNYTMHFQDLPFLEPGQHLPIAFRVNESRWSDGGIAWLFLTDNPIEAAVVWYDTGVRFRDAGEAPMKDIVRLMFDLENRTLCVTAVPYTQRPPDPPMQFA